MRCGTATEKRVLLLYGTSSNNYICICATHGHTWYIPESKLWEKTAVLLPRPWVIWLSEHVQKGEVVLCLKTVTEVGELVMSLLAKSSCIFVLGHADVRQSQHVDRLAGIAALEIRWAMDQTDILTAFRITGREKEVSDQLWICNLQQTARKSGWKGSARWALCR